LEYIQKNARFMQGVFRKCREERAANAPQREEKEEKKK